MNNKMIERITENEKRLDMVLLSIKKMQNALNDFKMNQKNIQLINKYYGSNNWFKDKEAYEQKKISKIKAGVLSEDAVWNMFEDIDDLIKKIEVIVKEYQKRK